MSDLSNQISPKKIIPWNNARFTGPKPPLKPKQVWAVRVRLQMAKRTRDLALFDLAIDSKLRGCDLVRLKIADISLHGVVQSRATVIQPKKAGGSARPDFAGRRAAYYSFSRPNGRGL